LVLLLGPAVYIASVHMIFVGSMRYRIPVMVPALGLAGMAAVVLIKARGGRGQP
jgi:hypothetical protein